MITWSKSLPYIGSIRLLQVFHYYDGPRLFTCENASGQLYLVTWVEAGTDHDRWFYLPISKSRLATTVSGKMSLFIAFSQPENGWLWEVVESHKGNRYQVNELKASEISLDDLPTKDAFIYFDIATLPVIDEAPIISAERTKRDVVDISLKVDGSHINEIDSDNLASVLLHTQALVRSLSFREPNPRKKIPKQIYKQTTLRVVGFYAASFGVRFQSDVTAGLYGETKLSSAIEQFMMLIHAKANPEKLADILNFLTPRARAKYRHFLTALKETNTALEAEWASPAKRVYRATLDLQDISNALNFITQSGLDITERLVYEGILVGINVRRRVFDFQNLEGERFTGLLSENFSDTTFEVPARVIAEIEERLEVNPATQDERYSYKLISISDPNDVDYTGVSAKQEILDLDKSIKPNLG